jgi:hypothetical protein
MTRRPALALLALLLLAAAPGCASNQPTPIQRAAATGELLNAAGRGVVTLRAQGKVSDADYRTFYALWTAACDAQAAFERYARAKALGQPTDLTAAEVDRLVATALDRVLLFYAARKPATALTVGELPR